MKKSQLRNIIRESIKELMNEQTQPTGIPLNPNVRCIKTTNCPQPSGTYTVNGTVNGQVAQVGQIIHGGIMHGRRAIIEVSPYQAGSCGSAIVDLPLSTSTDPCDACNNIPGGCPGLGSPPTSSCDNTMNGSCAQQWLPPSMNWNNMTNFACTGNNTYSGLISNRTAQVTNALQAQPIGLPSGGVNTLLTGANSPFTSWSAISGWVNQTNQSAQSGGAGSISKPGQLKRRIAQLKWAECMNTECSC